MQNGNPLPTLNTISPKQADAGDGNFVLTATGTDFLVGSTVRWNGSDRLTTYISDTELQTTITAADVAAAGSAAVTVNTPAPGGGTSATQSFNIVAAGGSAFFDGFARADSNDLGNLWVEKNTAAFSLNAETVVKQTTNSGHLDNLSYRPIAEALMDVEMSAELQLDDDRNPDYPQVLVRVQGGTVANPGTLEGYILYIDNNVSRAILGRQDGSDFVTLLSTINLNPAMNTTDTYRLRLRAEGTNPVSLEAYIERLTDGGWQVIGRSRLC